MHFVGHLYLKYLKAGNVKNTDEVLLLVLRVERLVNASDQPVEHSYVDGFCQRRHSVDHLCNMSETTSQVSRHSLSHKRRVVPVYHETC